MKIINSLLVIILSVSEIVANNSYLEKTLKEMAKAHKFLGVNKSINLNILLVYYSNNLNIKSII